MTKSQRKLHKLGNAIRAFRKGFKWVRVKSKLKDGKQRSFDVIGKPLPEKMAKSRVDRWAFRCRRAGLISDADEKKIVAIEFQMPEVKAAA